MIHFPTKHHRQFEYIRKLHFLLLPTLLCCILTQTVSAQHVKSKKPVIKASTWSYPPSNYTQVGSTSLYFCQTYYSIDIVGAFENTYYGSTYSNNGYSVAMQVGNNEAVEMDCQEGTTNNGVSFFATVEQQGELARVCYTVTNTNDEDVTVSLGVHADVMIGSNDHAPISRRVDSFGQTYGLTMKNGNSENAAQLCVLFGSGLAGVTAVSDFWFGYYYLNSDSYEMVGNYSSGGYWMEENGSYDSGMGWCWKDRSIAAGATCVFSYLIGVGEVNLEPNSSFEVTPDDIEGWNDLSRPHRLTLNGVYESPAGLEGFIDYAVEDSEDWQVLTDTLASGDEFNSSLVAMFDASRSTHIIKFRIRDVVGNTTTLRPIEYLDVGFYNLNGLQDKTYTGDSLFQTNLTCDLADDFYTVKGYRNNVNAGTASVNLEGVFPNSIGRRTYTFTIHPKTLIGGIELAETNFVYNGSAFTPQWSFTNTDYTILVDNTDYTAVWTNNRQPGTGTLTVTGKGNYTGTITASIIIDKASLTNNLFTLTMPEEDITYDGQSHGATISKSNGVGEAIITYLKQGTSEPVTTNPVDAGDYTIFLEFKEGTYYYGRERAQIGSFSIYQFDTDEWATLERIQPQLEEMGWKQPWNLTQGIKSASTLRGLTIEKGHITGLNLSNQNLIGEFPFEALSLSQLKNLNISGNQLTGNLGELANHFTNLSSLNAANNCFVEVSPMIPSSVSLNINGQNVPIKASCQLADLYSTSLSNLVPGILLYNHSLQTFVANTTLYCNSEQDGWGMSLVYRDGLPHATLQPTGENTFKGQSGDTFRASIGNNSRGFFDIQIFFDEGDANFDGQVDVTDLQAEILYITERYQSLFNFTAANLWQDDLINVQDVIRQVNLLMDQDFDNQAGSANSRINTISNDVEADADIFVQNGRLMLNTQQPVAAFHVVVYDANALRLTDALRQSGLSVNMKANDNGLHIIAYSMNGATLPSGITEIGTTDNGEALISHAVLSDSEAKTINVRLNNYATGISVVEPSTTDSTGIFDIQGRKLNVEPNRGLYIKNGKKMIK